jgi:hypothetical protein
MNLKKIEVVVVGSPDQTQLAVFTPAIIATSQLTTCLDRARSSFADARLGPAQWELFPFEERDSFSRYVPGTVAGLTFFRAQSSGRLDAAKSAIRRELENDGFEVTVLKAA